MKIKTLVVLLIVLVISSCSQRTPGSGLRIDNGINRGTNYTDSAGSNYSLRYIPVTITNDSTVPIKLQIAFSKEYNYPNPDNNEKFKLIPLPKEWALEGVGVTESMIDELAFYIQKPVLNESIEPGEKIVIAIGSLYPRPAKTTGVLPRILFTKSDTVTFPNCDWAMEKVHSSNQQISMGLKLMFGERCLIIGCGQISYPKH